MQWPGAYAVLRLPDVPIHSETSRGHVLHPDPDLWGEGAEPKTPRPMGREPWADRVQAGRRQVTDRVPDRLSGLRLWCSLPCELSLERFPVT